MNIVWLSLLYTAVAAVLLFDAGFIVFHLVHALEDESVLFLIIAILDLLVAIFCICFLANGGMDLIKTVLHLVE